MGTRRTFLRDHVAVRERFRRLGWLVLWLVARHSIRLWLAAPESTKIVADNRLDDHWAGDPSVRIARLPETGFLGRQLTLTREARKILPSRSA
jgi:hypothetical protein